MEKPPSLSFFVIAQGDVRIMLKAARCRRDMFEKGLLKALRFAAKMARNMCDLNLCSHISNSALATLVQRVVLRPRLHIMDGLASPRLKVLHHFSFAMKLFMSVKGLVFLGPLGRHEDMLRVVPSQ